MSSEIRCPWYTNGERFKGVLEKGSSETKQEGTFNGPDRNRVKEHFHCPECGRLYSRRWAWSWNSWDDRPVGKEEVNDGQ